MDLVFPGFCVVRLLSACCLIQESVLGGCGYPLNFRGRGLNLIDACPRIVDIARGLGVSKATMYTWPLRDRIVSGLASGTL